VSYIRIRYTYIHLNTYILEYTFNSRVKTNIRIYACIHRYTYICLYIYVYTMTVYTDLRICLYSLIYINYVFVYTCLHRHTYILVYTVIRICLYIYLYTPTYIYTCSNLYTYILVYSTYTPSYIHACSQNLDLTQHRLLYDGPLVWRISRDKLIPLHVVLLNDILLLLQKVDDRLVLRCQSMLIAAGKEETKMTHSPIIKLANLLNRSVATGLNIITLFIYLSCLFVTLQYYSNKNNN